MYEGSITRLNKFVDIIQGQVHQISTWLLSHYRPRERKQWKADHVVQVGHSGPTIAQGLLGDSCHGSGGCSAGTKQNGPRALDIMVQLACSNLSKVG